MLHRRDDLHRLGNRYVRLRCGEDWKLNLRLVVVKRTIPFSWAMTCNAAGMSGGSLLRCAVRID